MKAHSKYRLWSVLAVAIFWSTNIIIAPFMLYGKLTLATFFRVLPLSLNPNVLMISFFVPLVVFALYRSSVINQKKFKTGVEYGSAKKATKKDIEPFIETKTYWLNKIPVKEIKFKEFMDDLGMQKSIYLKTKSKLSFEEWKKKYAVVETNNSGTRNNLILSQDVKLGYFQANRKNKNVLLIGGSGTGKTRFVIKPNIMQMNGSYVVTDPKGTILNEIGYLLQKSGYKIKVFNTIDFDKSLKYNPFAYIYDEKDINTLVQTFMSNTKDPNSKGGDQFWDDAMRMLLIALITYLWKHCLPEEQNFANVLRLVNLMKFDGDDQNTMTPVDYLFEDLQVKYDQDKISNPSLVQPYELSSYLGYKTAAGDTAKSILISCTSRLQPFAMQAIADLTSEDQIKFEERDSITGQLIDCMGSSKQVLFCIIPDSDPTYNFLVGMLYTQLFNRLITTADNDFGGRFPLPVICLLDEFANIGLIPNFEKLIATIRSRNISAIPVLQAKSQLKAIYKDSADTIIGNCDSEIFLGGKEMSTLKEVVESLGKETIDLSTTSKTYSQSNSQGINFNKTGRELITIDELKTMPDDECIVQVRGLNPFVKVKKFDIEKHPMYKFHANDQDSKYWFDIADYIKKFNKKEKASNLQKLQFELNSLNESEIKAFSPGMRIKEISFSMEEEINLVKESS